MSKTTAPRAKVGRTSDGLKDAIFDELDDLRAGISNPTKSNAVAKLATALIDTVNMELGVHKALAMIKPGTPAQPKALPNVILSAK